MKIRPYPLNENSPVSTQPLVAWQNFKILRLLFTSMKNLVFKNFYNLVSKEWKTFKFLFGSILKIFFHTLIKKIVLTPSSVTKNQQTSIHIRMINKLG